MTRSLLEEEFEDFLSGGEVLEAGVLDPARERVVALLHPNGWSVFAKLGAIHLAVGVLTLAFCPQFGVKIGAFGLGLARLFAYFGAYGCMVGCGAFFMGSSLVAAGCLLKPEEVRVLRGHQVLQLAALALLSLGAFVMLDAQILAGYAAVWAVGSTLGGVAALELTWLFRVRALFG